MPAERISYSDVMRIGTDKLNKAIDIANKVEGDIIVNEAIAQDAVSTAQSAVSTAEVAVVKADQAIGQATYTQTQLNNIVIQSGTSDAEVIQARGDKAVLNERLDEFDSGLATTMKTGKPTIGYAGVIRRNASEWFYIEDAVHEKVNMLTVSETANNEIEVTYESSQKVGSMLVVPDETFAALGLIAGASVGDFRAFIKCFAPFVGFISSNGTVINTNPLFTGTATSVVSVDKTKITVSYDGAGNGLEKALVSPVNDNSAPYTGIDYQTGRTGAGAVEIRAFHPLYANISYNGSEWVVATSCKANIVAAWDSVTNELVVSHDAMPSAAGYNQFLDVALSLRKSLSGSLLHGRIVSVTQSQIRIEFYNDSGTKITAPNTNVRFYLSRPGFKVPHEIPPGARIYFDFGYSIVRPSKMNIPFSNLWLLGIHNE